jgi:hypothetical protein
MKKILLIIGILSLTFLLYSKFQTNIDTSYKPDFFYLGGIQINEANNEDWMSLLKKAQMNTVEVTVYAKQGAWDSDSLRFDAVDAGVMAEIRAASTSNTKVFDREWRTF